MKAGIGMLELVILMVFLVGATPLLVQLMHVCNTDRFEYLEDKTTMPAYFSDDRVPNANGVGNSRYTYLEVPYSIKWSDMVMMAFVNDDFVPDEADAYIVTNVNPLSANNPIVSSIPANIGGYDGNIKDYYFFSSIEGYKQKRASVFTQMWSSTFNYAKSNHDLRFNSGYQDNQQRYYLYWNSNIDITENNRNNGGVWFITQNPYNLYK